MRSCSIWRATRASVRSKGSWRTALRSQTCRHESGSSPNAGRSLLAVCLRRSPGQRPGRGLGALGPLPRVRCRAAHRILTRARWAASASRSSSPPARRCATSFGRRRALLRHQVPCGDLSEIFDRALTLLVEDTKRKKFALTSRPRTRSGASRKAGTASRHIPAEIKRAVFERDEGRCAFAGRNGRRCASRDFLEYHHLDPWARSKRHSIERIELRCRGHNHYAAMLDYGSEHMARFAREDNVPRGTFDVDTPE